MSNRGVDTLRSPTPVREQNPRNDLMLRAAMLGGLVLAMLLNVTVRPAQAQLIASLADDLVILTYRLRGKEAARTHQHLGPGPGSMESAFPVIPGAPAPPPGEPSSATTPGQANITPPPALAKTPRPSRITGGLEFPAPPEKGPPHEMTFDETKKRLVRNN